MDDERILAALARIEGEAHATNVRLDQLEQRTLAGEVQMDKRFERLEQVVAHGMREMTLAAIGVADQIKARSADQARLAKIEERVTALEKKAG